MSAPVLEETKSGFRLRVKAQPRAAADRIEGVVAGADGGARLKVRVRAAPEKGAANAAIAKLLAKALGVPKTAVTLHAGGASRDKVFAVAAPAGHPALDAARGLVQGSAP
ncbi:hypothetical protein DDZ18_00970 [Marinicauda salina]|uniref:UPF0235 protein DDZ18_00970 n=1 Tax=Marinicauda salina TaxID=2135793 RepID=A0A2U2BW22_9PROT|nr:DUF167 domain-containing protein [Marinicauda salina]PWE18213.1 hypothetical protein DDZ18_00970 [Marinicauda salina]